MSSRGWISIVILLAVIIFVLAWLLFTTPAEAPVRSPIATSTNEAVLPAPTASASSSQGAPLDTQVVVATPAGNATVSHTLDVSGSAPNQWFYEAVFPIQVRDSDDDLIGSAQGQAQSDWTQPGQIKFTAQIAVDSSYEGPATLILLKDNPSGLPQNADEVTVPIVIK